MRSALRIVRSAFRIWWDNLVHMTFFNTLWILAQFLIITGPPATAAMYALTVQFMERDLIVPKDFFLALKSMFLPAWKWGALNILIFAILVMNFAGSIFQEGEIWFCLRGIWIVMGILWYILNLFYWPLWLSEHDQRLINTYRNSLVMLLRMPMLVITISVISAVLIVASIVLLFPLALALMVWLSLIGMLTVQLAIKEVIQQGE
ncbi:MAG: DUF624 domain-containing protein [Anaerolineales bacterium]|nr:DUF624 domain-containing protein [Anaerolineales bacterium]